jgi:hypothetical protein
VAAAWRGWGEEKWEFRWRLARVKRGVVVGPAKMGLLGLRFKTRERR